MEINIGNVPAVSASIRKPTAVTFDMDASHGIQLPEYKGETVVVPSEEEQILKTGGHTVNDNIVIKPIPSNWGKISYNGAFLMVE